MIRKKKIHLHFDPLHLKFYHVSPSMKQKLLKALWKISAGLVFSAVITLIAFSTIDSPKEKMLKREIEHYKLQYAELNDKIEQVQTVLKDMEQRDDNIYRVIFETDPIPQSVRNAGYGGAEKYSKLEGYNNSELIINTTKNLDRLSRQVYVQSKSFDEVINLAKNKTEMLSSIPAIIPISKKKGIIASGFGYRVHPIYKVMRMHQGIDIAARTGTPIYATGNGTVERNDASVNGMGIVCIINHGYGYKSIYGHMSKTAVKPGQKIKRGQVIGYVGSTGISIGPHVHYEVLKNGKHVNPVNYFYNDLSPEEYQQVIEEASKVNQALS